MKKEIKMITNFKTFKGIQKKKKKKSTILHTHFLHMYTQKKIYKNNNYE